jgi:hypothetical protein
MNRAAITLNTAAFDYELEFKGSVELYGSSNAAGFRLVRRNFWLDSDRFRYYSLPLIDSGGIVELQGKISRGDTAAVAGFIEDGISFIFAADSERLSEYSLQLRAVRTFGTSRLLPEQLRGVSESLEIIADIRGVVYNYPGLSAEYLDIFLALRKEIGSHGWIMAGTGLNPYRFDRWKYGIVPYGREFHIEESGVKNSASTGFHDRAINKLREAEKNISIDHSFSVEAGFSF